MCPERLQPRTRLQPCKTGKCYQSPSDGHFHLLSTEYVDSHSEALPTGELQVWHFIHHCPTKKRLATFFSRKAQIAPQFRSLCMPANTVDSITTESVVHLCSKLKCLHQKAMSHFFFIPGSSRTSLIAIRK
jgi:hypothetical protein